MIHFWKMCLKDIRPKLNNSHKFLGGDSLTKIFLPLPLLLHLFPMMVQGDAASVRPKPPKVLLDEAGASAGPWSLSFFSITENLPLGVKFTQYKKKIKIKKFNLLAKLTKLVETDKCINQFLEISNSLCRMSDQ